jgi:hypothetical protein
MRPFYLLVLLLVVGCVSGAQAPEPMLVPTPAATDFARRIAGCYRLEDGSWRADSVLAGDISTTHTPLFLELTDQLLSGVESLQSSERPMWAVRDSTEIFSYWQRDSGSSNGSRPRPPA